MYIWQGYKMHLAKVCLTLIKLYETGPRPFYLQLQRKIGTLVYEVLNFHCKVIFSDILLRIEVGIFWNKLTSRLLHPLLTGLYSDTMYLIQSQAWNIQYVGTMFHSQIPCFNFSVLMFLLFAVCTCVVHKRCHQHVVTKCPGSKEAPGEDPVRFRIILCLCRLY